MTPTKKALPIVSKYSPAAYEFVDLALRFTQKKLGKHVVAGEEPPTEDAHISGQQLLEGIRDLALREFGMMTIPVFRHWGIHSTEDFGRIVWEQIEQGRMRKTDRDQFADFSAAYDFEEVFDREYKVDTSAAFR